MSKDSNLGGGNPFNPVPTTSGPYVPVSKQPGETQEEFIKRDEQNGRDYLCSWILRKLGSPIVEINVTKEQINERIDEALYEYQRFHFDAYIRMYFKHRITENDVSSRSGSREIVVDCRHFGGLLRVTRVLPLTSLVGQAGFFSFRYQLYLNDIITLGSFAGAGGTGFLSNYAQFQQYISLIENVLEGHVPTEYAMWDKKLHIFGKSGDELKIGSIVILDTFVATTNFWNDLWFKRYSAALVKLQWGENLSKFEGLQLVGGYTFNSSRIIEDAQNELTRLREELQTTYDTIPGWFIG